MERAIRQYGVKEPTSFTCVKWCPHVPNLLAVGSGANYGVVGKGAVHLKAIEGPNLKTVAVFEEAVFIRLDRYKNWHPGSSV
jgi:hypothetical protein